MPPNSDPSRIGFIPERGPGIGSSFRPPVPAGTSGNHFLARNRRDYATYKLRKAMFDAGLVVDKPSPPSVSFQSMGVRFTALRHETPWLQRLPYVPVRYALKYQAEAWKRAFAEGGFPRFKARRGDDSFTIPQNVRVRDGVLSVPKVGRVRLSRRGGNPHAGCPPVKATGQAGQRKVVLCGGLQGICGDPPGQRARPRRGHELRAGGGVHWQPAPHA